MYTIPVTAMPIFFKFNHFNFIIKNNIEKFTNKARLEDGGGVPGYTILHHLQAIEIDRKQIH